MRPITRCWLTLGLTFVAASPAAAYLDPAAGSMVLQLVLAGAAGAAVVLKLVWGRLLGVFGIRRGTRPAEGDGSGPSGEA
jgi:hypothetical protein